MDLETRVSNLENLVNGLIDMINGNKFYTSADISGIRKVDASQEVNIKDNSDGLFDVASMADENSEAAFDLADEIDDLERRVAALEEGYHG